MKTGDIPCLSTGPLHVASIAWQPRQAMWAITVVAKATFLLTPNKAEIAPEQDPIFEEDEHWDDDETRSLRAPGDLAPLKPRADVVLVGMAFAPPPNPARSFTTRLIVANIDKSIEIFCDRFFDKDGALVEGPPVTRLPLHYERAAGGSESWNPVGMRPDARDHAGRIAVPNLQPPGLATSRPGDVIPGIGYGPIAARWPLRLQRLGHHAAPLTRADLKRGPLPENIDHGYFNVAPHDQQVNALRHDERIALYNLHPRHPHFVTNLPGVHPKAVFTGRDGGPVLIAMRADTLVIDTERALCTMTWRGQLPLRHAAEEGHIMVALERPGEELSPSDIVQMVQGAARPAPAKLVTALPEHLVTTTTLSEQEIAQAAGIALPFASSSPIAANPARIAAPRESAPSLPFAPPPTFVPRPPEVNPPPFAAVPPPLPPPLPPKTIGESVVAAALGVSAPIIATPDPPRPRNDASVHAAPQRPHHDAVVLHWLDRPSMLRIVRKTAWEPLLDALEDAPVDPEVDDPALSSDPSEIEEQTQAYVILRNGIRLDRQGILDALDAAMSRHGRFAPPIDLVEGDLKLLFDEYEQLGALVAIVSPLVQGDASLTPLLDTAQRLLAMPSSSRASPAAAGLAAQIRTTYAQGKRPLAPAELDAHVESSMLEKRSYQKRKVFGGEHLRALVHLLGDKDPVLAYVPAEAAEELPLLTRFRARMICECHFAVDARAASPVALRALALGRIVDVSRR